MQTIENFFMNAKNTIGPIGTNYISLSAGTDSRTILALLRHYHIKHKAISFGKLNMFETDRIKKFAKKYKCESHTDYRHIIHKVDALSIVTPTNWV